MDDVLSFLSAANAGGPALAAERDEFDLVQQPAREGSLFFADQGRGFGAHALPPLRKSNSEDTKFPGFIG